jgi:hypothetical protein
MSRKEDVEKYFKLQFGLDTTDEKRKDAKNLQIEMLSDLRYIYRYRGVGEIERLVSCIKKGQPIEMRLSHPSNLNDPYDTWLPLVYLKTKEKRREITRSCYKLACEKGNLDSVKSKECCEKYRSNLEISDFDEWFDKIFEILLEYWKNPITKEELKKKQIQKISEVHKKSWRKEQENFGIASFSERCDSLLMWAHYADSHKGICLVYDVKALFGIRDPKDILDWIHPVRYVPDTSEILSEWEKIATGQELTDAQKEDIFKKTLLIKSLDWEYENEWRFAFRFPDAEYQSLPWAPCCIYLGVNIDAKNEEDIRKIANERNISVNKMQLSDNQYKLIVGD